MTAQETFEKMYADLEKMIYDLNLQAVEVEKDHPADADLMRELAMDTFEILKKVAGKVNFCAGCPGCSSC